PADGRALARRTQPCAGTAMADSRDVAVALVALAAALASVGCLEQRAGFESDGSQRCTSCHGAARAEQDDLRQSAPPTDLSGNTDVRYPGVGAHDIHLSASS